VDAGRLGVAVADRADPESVLAALDPEQRQVALATRGPVCVLAGAGTGKTRAIAHRIAYAALTGVVDPGHVLALTFTTRAAGELRARVHQLAGRGAGLERVQARTFHSAALRQLSHFWPRTVGGRPPTVLDSKIGLLAEVARRVRAGTSSAELRDVAAEIEWAKVLGVPPDGYPDAAARAGRSAPLAPATVGRLYASYEELRRERHLVDFESVLELTAAILAEHPEAAALIRDRYRYLVVDEYQDVNPLQKLLLDSWAGDRDDVCVVGDPRQTIYSFAGATASYLTGFSADFPAATVLRLVRNYRSTPQVVALANQLTGLAGRQPLAAQLRAAGAAGARAAGARAAGARAAGARGAGAGAAGGSTAALVAQRPAGPAVEFTGYPDEQQEASAIATRVAALHAAGAPLSQAAVLVRTNAQTLPLEQAFARLGLPCQLRGAERFFDRPEVRQAVGLLRAAAKSADADAGLAGGGLAGGGLAAEVRHILAGLGLTPEPPAGRGAARERWESLAALAQLAEDYFAAAAAGVAASGGGDGGANGDGANGDGDGGGGGGGGLRGFAAELAHRSQIEHAPAMHAVTLASLHAAKGLEWDVVFLAGLAEGTLPIVHAQTDEAVEEERRLLYVGVTRAREQLFLSWPLAWSGGGRRTRQPSRFLAGLQSATRRAAALA
jgi:DNA helicase-2/ATP-dependent DNA helicase PcrA